MKFRSEPDETLCSRIEVERQRILEEYKRREREINPDRYASWSPSETLAICERKRVAAAMLHRFGCFPSLDTACLEIGVGRLGWLADLLSWGISERNLCGIDISEQRINSARSIFPVADLRCGDATTLPWHSGLFGLVVCSTVFSSVLDEYVRLRIISEIRRILAPAGVVLWYDFAVNNPRNHRVRGVRRKKLLEYFGGFEAHTRRVTLAPPLSRSIAPVSWSLATLISGVPFARTHLLGIFIKPR